MKFLILSLVLLLAACADPAAVPIQTTRFVVVQPPESFYVCNRPDVPAGNTEDDAGRLLLQYEHNISNCISNMQAIRRYLQDAERNSQPSAQN